MQYRLVNENFKKDYGENLLRSRGIENIESFLNPTIDLLQDWLDLNHIMAAAEVVKKYINDNSKFAIVADCDVDGFTSAAILYQYLKRINTNKEIDYYIHEKKQHGLEDTWEKIKDNEPYSIIFLPDAGSNDAVYADELASFIIVLDHHIVEKEPSHNMTVVNNQSSIQYNNKDLSGAGVTWQFCRALDYGFEVNYAWDYIDLTALSLVGDMMSMLSYENRYIVKTGFENIQNYFFQVLIEKQSYSMNDKVNPMTVAFYIVPLINAMIRVGTMEEKERLFLAFIDGHKMVECHKRGAKGTMEEVAVESARECTNAKSKQDKTKEKIVESLEIKIHKHGLLDNQILFVRLDDEDDFPSELNGLVAMQLSAKYKKPTILARLNSEGYIRGSIRGVNDSGLKSFKEYLDSTGLFEYVTGHDNAAGCSIPKDKLSELHKLANDDLATIDFGDAYYDVNFIRNACDNDIADIINDLAAYEDVWGQGNKEALVCVQYINVDKSDIQIMGRNADTVKIMKNGVAYMKFHAKQFIEDLNQYGQVQINIIGKPNLNEFRGTYTPQIFISAYEIRNGALAF